MPQYHIAAQTLPYKAWADEIVVECKNVLAFQSSSISIFKLPETKSRDILYPRGFGAIAPHL